MIDTHTAFYDGVGTHSWVHYCTDVDVVDYHEYTRNEMKEPSITDNFCIQGIKTSSFSSQALLLSPPAQASIAGVSCLLAPPRSPAAGVSLLGQRL